MRVDSLIIGQGLCGTLLSRALMAAGRSVMVIDIAASDASSRVAGGLVNPVTGKRLVRSWMTEQLLPFAENVYRAIGDEIGADLVQRTSILEFFPTRESADLFSKRASEDPEYLATIHDSKQWGEFFRFNYGIGAIAPALTVDLRAMLDGWRTVLAKRDALRSERFVVDELHTVPEGIRYRDVEASNVIFCDGVASAKGKWFSALPWSDDKGEVLILSIPGLPRENIYKQGVSLVPWGNHLFWAGASHDWKHPHTGITEAFRAATVERLNYWLKLPYTVEDHISALRPANFDRKPFVGFHPVKKQVGIFNGMGGKGISMAPWFAAQFAEHICNNTPLLPDVDVTRYKKMLERSLP